MIVVAALFKTPSMLLELPFIPKAAVVLLGQRIQCQTPYLTYFHIAGQLHPMAVLPHSQQLQGQILAIQRYHSQIYSIRMLTKIISLL